MKKIFLFLSSVMLLMIIMFNSSYAEPSSITLKVMTYNIGSAAGIPLETKQMNQIADQMAAEKVDLAGFQEVDVGPDRHQNRDLASEISVALSSRKWPMYHYYTPTIPYPGGTMGLAIFSRFPIQVEDYRVTVPIASETWKVARVEIRLPNETTLDFYTTHYWIGDGSRHQHQTETIINFLRESKGPKILTGDFNLTPDQPYFKQLLDYGLQEACLTANATHCPTVGKGAGIVAPELIKQIDYIFVSPEFKVLKAWVPDSTVSDHWPILAEVKVEVRS